ncbi:MAG TPA: response regulator [Steroidobacteraceae bacterium]|jgi:signal transduction histidine kinase/CheY-like chemotaxis protein|nr:response regulator [Steroidobacteraceae bacterium]
MVGKILVAEDDPEARELLLLLLEGGEYSLLEAADGMEALDLLRAEQPDLLITDIVMPRMDGYELVRRLREDDRTAHTSVIFCSASYHEREVREMARSLGVQSTLAKPFDHKTVRTVVDATLAARSSLADTVSTPAVQVIGNAQERLSALVAFSRRLFGHTEAEAIVESTCHAARDILLAQCAQLVLADDEGTRHTCTASGLSTEQVERLLRTRMYTEMLQSLEKGGCALFPMVPADTSPSGGTNQPGDFVSMLGVPVASVSHHYGYLCVINRIGLPGFTDEDLAVARAIAAQVAVAYENARRYYDLELRVAERTAELEVANRELEAFSYSVAHDLRAPLRLIHAHVQMLRDYRGSPTAREPLIHLDQIQRGAREMSSLIDGLLALSRISHMEMRREMTSLDELVKRAVNQVRQESGDRVVEWRLASLPSVACDPDLMLQVFANLIDNAVKYSRPRAHAVIEIGVGIADGEKYVFVRDNGVGFDMRYARKLFGVFQRLHRQDEFEGTGIGLATVSRIIERHNGRIWAESRLGQGAEFRFTLAGL